tara:strand:+ start:332 stop:796 length:465 start_codon:yes stop_codon:yes gene_type:complete
MNIFILDQNPKIAATMLCDKHVVKMIVETAQILCTVSHGLGYVEAPYRATHKNHPCTLWVAKSRENWNWLLEHGLEMCAEYTKRYGKIHKSQAVIEWCAKIPNPPKWDKLTPFAQAMPVQYKDSNPVVAYRNYYKGEKSSFAKWKTQSPSWWPK